MVLGYDVIDCWSGGIAADRSHSVTTALTRRLGFQVPFAEEMRKKLKGMMTVGSIVNPRHVEAILERGRPI